MEIFLLGENGENDFVGHIDYEHLGKDLDVIIDCLEKRTGVYIDPYGDTLIYTNQSKIMLECIEKFENKIINAKSLILLKSILVNHRSKGSVLKFVGD